VILYHFVDEGFFRGWDGTQIAGVLDQYAKLTPGDYDTILLVERRLFWAFISGSAEAGGYLNSFNQKFGPFTETTSDEFNEVHSLVGQRYHRL